MRPLLKLRSCSQKGFTLVEIMVATMMTAAIVAAGFGALVVSQKTTRITGQISSTQATARNALDMITADLKLAGFGMRGLTTTVGGCQINGTPSALVPGDNNPIGADIGPDTISMVVPMTNSIVAVGPLWQVFVPGAPGTIGGLQTPITNIPMPANATTAMGTAIPGGGAALLGMPVSIGGMAGSTIQAVSPGGLTLNQAIPAPAAFGTGTQVYLLQCITYEVVPPPDLLNLCQGNAPCLVRGVGVVGVPNTPPRCNTVGSACVPIMDGVEDLQLAYACDGCDPRINGGMPDLQPDDINGSNQFDQADFITDRNWFVNNVWPFFGWMTPRTIRLVQVTIVARQTRADQGMGEGQATPVHTTTFPIISDHNHATGLFALGDMASPAQQSAYFQFRRRILTRTIELRNQRF